MPQQPSAKQTSRFASGVKQRHTSTPVPAMNGVANKIPSDSQLAKLADMAKAVYSSIDLAPSSIRDLLHLRNPIDQWLTPHSGENRTTVTEPLNNLGNLVDLPTSSFRDALAGKGWGESFDQWRTPTSGQNRSTGRDVNRAWGLAGDQDNWANFAGGLVTDLIADPANLIAGAGIAKKLVKARHSDDVFKTGRLATEVPTTKTTPTLEGRQHLAGSFIGLNESDKLTILRGPSDEAAKLMVAHDPKTFIPPGMTRQQFAMSDAVKEHRNPISRRAPFTTYTYPRAVDETAGFVRGTLRPDLSFVRDDIAAGKYGGVKQKFSTISHEATHNWQGHHPEQMKAFYRSLASEPKHNAIWNYFSKVGHSPNTVANKIAALDSRVLPKETLAELVGGTVREGYVSGLPGPKNPLVSYLNQGSGLSKYDASELMGRQMKSRFGSGADVMGTPRLRVVNGTVFPNMPWEQNYSRQFMNYLDQTTPSPGIEEFAKGRGLIESGGRNPMMIFSSPDTPRPSIKPNLKAIGVYHAAKRPAKHLPGENNKRKKNPVQLGP